MYCNRHLVEEQDTNDNDGGYDKRWRYEGCNIRGVAVVLI